jgi:hypothetical protein
MEVDEWFSMNNSVVGRCEDLTGRAEKLTERVIEQIDSTGQIVSHQWQKTHNLAVDQSEQGLKAQSKLTVAQYDVKYLAFFMSYF